ncbi:MAG: pyridoxamine 5'-phosphate oxidase [Aeromicrobium sp.]
MESPDLAALRAEYAREGLEEADAGTDPVDLFAQWLEVAVTAGIHEPNAMALATADTSGRPSVRIVLLKGFDAAGAVFYTNYDSRKGRELVANPLASAVLLWHQLQRQVRIEGRVERVEPELSDAYFASRPRGAQIGAVASQQSRSVGDREALEAKVADVERTFDGRDVQRPEHWGGYRITLDAVEFWQGRADRVHDRLRFTRVGDGWSRERLQP